VYPDERVGKLITEHFIPARVHVREQAADFQRFGDRYAAHWTPTILELDPDGTEQHRVEGFLEADDLLAQLTLGLGKSAFKAKRWQDAERHFREVVDRYPGSDAAAEALYWAGVSRYRATGDASALGATAAAFSSRYEDSIWAKKASIWKG
jgi:TolA-binding protein